MPYLLSLETSSSVCSVAIHKAGKLVCASELHLEKSHSALVTVLVQDLLKYAGLTLANLSGIAISGGPGSYTGLRIGTSTAKGLCFGLDLPLIEVSTLEAMALAQIRATPQAAQLLFCPMLDARRLEVYCAVYNQNLEPVLPVAPVVLTEASFAELVAAQPVLFFGSGADKFRDLISPNPNAWFISGAAPNAAFIGELAYRKYHQQQFEVIAYYEPFYLKEFYTTAKLPGV